jgi:hypothetical protein
MKKNSMTNLILSTALLMLFFLHPCYADHLTSLDSISNLNFSRGETQFTAPYSILANTTFTADLNTYRFKNYEIKIINSENPDRLIFEVTKNNHTKITENSSFDIEKHLPWWSKSAPKILKKLDFTKVDGESNAYDMGNNYRLTLLAKQGNWGKVYVLEHLSKNSNAQKICAVKLILTRSDRKMEVAEFHERHKEELKNNLIIADQDVAVKPYAIIKNDADHYLLFMEYGESAHQYFKSNPLNTTLERVYQFLNVVNKMHLNGFAHGDLKLDNVLLIKNKFKLCDWYSLININKTNVGQYRYYGDNLPPEAIRALYFKTDNLKYSLVRDQSKMKSYFLHPIAADRFCLAVSLMEIVAPDLEKAFYSTFPNGFFNFYSPDSLEFWPKYVKQIRKIQRELLSRSKNIQNKKERQLYKQISKYLDVDPMQRNT